MVQTGAQRGQEHTSPEGPSAGMFAGTDSPYAVRRRLVDIV